MLESPRLRLLEPPILWELDEVLAKVLEPARLRLLEPPILGEVFIVVVCPPRLFRFVDAIIL